MITTALALVWLTAGAEAGDEPRRVLSDDDRASVVAAVGDLVTRAVGHKPARYRLAVIAPGLLGADDHLELHLAPLTAAVREALAALRGLVLLSDPQVAERGGALLAAPDLAKTDWALSLATAVGADGVLLLPGRQRDDEVAITAQWIDAAQKKLLAVAPLKARPVEIASEDAEELEDERDDADEDARELRLDAPATAAGAREARASFTMMAVGIGMCGAGAIGGVVGAVVIGLGSVENSQTCTGTGANKTCRPLTDAERKAMRDVGLAILIAGGAVALAGIPVAILGGRKVPVEEPQASARPEVGIGPGAVSLTWRL